MHAVSQKPQAAAIQGYTKLFQSYKSGIISSPECGTKVDHAVIITGYDTTGEVPYYIVKNSWGLNWGE
jgi:C1A family cysteine protease